MFGAGKNAASFTHIISWIKAWTGFTAYAAEVLCMKVKQIK
jgi:hypothetical protein